MPITWLNYAAETLQKERDGNIRWSWNLIGTCPSQFHGGENINAQKLRDRKCRWGSCEYGKSTRWEINTTMRRKIVHQTNWRTLRQEKAKPILDNSFNWLAKKKILIVPKSLMWILITFEPKGLSIINMNTFYRLYSSIRHEMKLSSSWPSPTPRHLYECLLDRDWCPTQHW